MKIIAVEIVGFKSQGERVAVNKWSSHFNAITGKNGSGKSNFLDAIVFCLGLTKKHNAVIRCSNPKEILFSSGNARIRKGQVRIVFDNTDKERSPPEYTKHDKITIERHFDLANTDIFKINDKSVLLAEHRKMLMSVSLNIDNPRFMVLQNQILRLSNLKEAEYLNLLQECCGIKMQDDIIKKSQRELDAKITMFSNTKIRLNELSEELEKEEKNKDKYNRKKLLEDKLSSAQVTRQLYDWYNAKSLVENRDVKKSALEEDMKNLEIEKRNIQNRRVELIRLKEEIEKFRLNSPKTELNNHQRQVKEEKVNYESDLKDTETELAEQQQEIKKLQKDITNTNKKIKDLDTLPQKMLQEKEDNDKEITLLKEQIKVKSAIMTNGNVNENDNTRLRNDIQSNLRNKEREKDRQEKQKEDLTKEIKKFKDENDDLKKKREDKAFIREMDNLKSKLNNKNSELQIIVAELSMNQSSKVNELHNRLIPIKQQLSNDWLFNNQMSPSGLLIENLDKPDLQLGRLLDLFTIKNEYVRNKNLLIAFEEHTAGSFWNFIAKDETVSKDYKDNYNLSFNNAPSFCALKQINRSEFFNQQRKDQIRSYARESQNLNAIFPMEMIEYNPDLENLMQSKFGNFFILQGQDSNNPNSTESKRVYNAALDCSVKFTCTVSIGCVTFHTGTMKGKIIPDTHFETKLEKYHQKRDVFAQQLDLNKRIRFMKDKMISANTMTQKKIVLESEINQIRFDIDQKTNQNENRTEHNENEIERKTAELETVQEKIDFIKNQIKEQDAKFKDLQGDSSKTMDQHKKDRDEQMKQVAQFENRNKEIQNVIEDIPQRRVEYEQSIQDQDNQINLILRTIPTLKGKIEEIKSHINVTLEKLNAIDVKLKELAEKLSKEDKLEDDQEKEIEDIDTNRLEKVNDKIHQRHLDLTNLETQFQHRIIALKKLEDNPEVKRVLEDRSENSKFFLLGTAPEQRFDEAWKRNFDHETEKMQSEVDKLKREVNDDLQSSLSNMKEEIKDLDAKRKILDEDIKELKNIIRKNEPKKKEELELAFREVSDNMSKIFKDLLKDADAKLEMKDPNDINEGIRVRVCFNGDWNQQLSTLSGGQKSFLVVSLIFAMLKKNPAPIYILDEIDAPLDENNTYNLSRVIKDHFPESQFIIVSLKRDFFRNADVIHTVSGRQQDGILNSSVKTDVMNEAFLIKRN